MHIYTGDYCKSAELNISHHNKESETKYSEDLKMKIMWKFRKEMHTFPPTKPMVLYVGQKVTVKAGDDDESFDITISGLWDKNNKAIKDGISVYCLLEWRINYS